MGSLHEVNLNLMYPFGFSSKYFMFIYWQLSFSIPPFLFYSSHLLPPSFPPFLFPLLSPTLLSSFSPPSILFFLYSVSLPPPPLLFSLPSTPSTLLPSLVISFSALLCLISPISFYLHSSYFLSSLSPSPLILYSSSHFFLFTLPPFSSLHPFHSFPPHFFSPNTIFQSFNDIRDYFRYLFLIFQRNIGSSQT